MKWGEKITFGMLIVSMFFSTAVLGRNLWMQEKEQIKFEILRNSISAERERSSATAEVKRTGDKMMKSLNGEERAVLPEYQELAEKTPDFVGWIFIDGTNIDYPVMQTLWEPEYYLHRNFTGEYSYAGVPFVGSGDIEAENEDIFIYGHNMKNGTMFADLLKYQSIEFWKTHPIIRLDTLWARYQYEIFTVLYADESDWENETDALFSLTDEKDLSEQRTYFQKLKQREIYETGIVPDDNASLLYLVTCCYQKSGERFVVIGRLKRE